MRRPEITLHPGLPACGSLYLLAPSLSSTVGCWLRALRGINERKAAMFPLLAQFV
jgi:hypothetical protein